MTMAESPARRLRLGMVGGGAGSLIGDSHRIASRLDERYELVAGALDIDPERGKRFAATLGIAPDRAYDDYRQMIERERVRPDGCDLVTVATPNNTHFEIAHALVQGGFNVLCEKPLTTRGEDAIALAKAVRDRDVVFAVMYGYTGYPLAREARAMVAAGELGAVRVVQTEFLHGFMAGPSGQSGAQGVWRLDPSIQGRSFALADVGTHALFLASFIIGQQVAEVAADLHRFVPGRELDDNAHVLMRFDGGAKGMLWASGVAAGVTHGHRIRIFGERGGLEWHQSRPNELTYLPQNGRPQVIERDAPGLSAASRFRSRISAGHPGGYFEAWANVYSDVADAIAARIAGKPADPLALQFPTVGDGVRGVKFVDAALASAQQGGGWVDARV
ncbi:MAG: Gfo/Idh/MocA family oxidoreductase [Methylobacteriaceae bacterium]|nr:Gfo/Idh/MocA family oxidoreductase [Methylobacteriaceae bacterium]